MIYTLTIFNFAIIDLKQVKRPSQTSAFPRSASVCLQEHPEKKTTVKKDPLDSTGFRETLTRAEHECIIRTRIWKHTSRKAFLSAFHTHEDQAHCLQCVWENAEMAPPSCEEFLRPHERMEGGGRWQKP